jgi:methylmalonyl-CoA mutase cobalamin-binding domain/chain
MGIPSMEHLIVALIEGDRTRAVNEAGYLIEAGVTRERIIAEGLEVAMKRLESKCTLEQFNLLEIMVAGRAVMAVMNHVYPDGSRPVSTKGTVVIATLEGDVHDLGKNILGMVLVAGGYHVVDCGKDCPPGLLVATVKREDAKAVCVSGLITSVIPLVRKLKGSLAGAGLTDIPVIAGGAALKMASAGNLNVDLVCDSAFDAAKYLDNVRGGTA